MSAPSLEGFYRCGICDHRVGRDSATCDQCGWYVHYKCSKTSYKKVVGQSSSSTPEDISCQKEGRVANGALEKVKKMWLKPFDAPLHMNENVEQDIDELYRNEIVI